MQNPEDVAVKALQSLYLLAGDQNFRLLHAKGADLIELAQHRADEFPDVKDHFSAQDSRGHTSTVSYDVTDRGAHRDEERIRFGRHAVTALETEWARAGYDRIIISAGPKMLGVLRDLLPKALAGHVAAQLHKDLINTPLHELARHFEGVPGV